MIKEIETNLFFDTFLEKPYGIWISLIQLATNHMLYKDYIVLPDYAWGILTKDTTFNGVKRDE